MDKRIVPKSLGIISDKRILKPRMHDTFRPSQMQKTIPPGRGKGAPYKRDKYRWRVTPVSLYLRDLAAMLNNKTEGVV